MNRYIAILLIFVVGCSVNNNYGVVVENDLVAKTDKNYTHGTRFKRISIPENRSNTIRYIAETLPAIRLFDSDPRDLSFIETEIGQEIHTPDNIRIREPILDDNPYAGYLYSKLYRINSSKNTLLETSIETGVIGPLSFADKTQRFVHNDLGLGADPVGWDNQLKNEPIFNFNYRRVRQYNPLSYLYPYSETGVRLGNLYTDFVFTNGIKVGYNIPHLDASNSDIPGVYLFGNSNLQLVARNIFYDGNTFRTSQSVDTIPVVGSVDYGAAVAYRGYNVKFKVTTSSKQYEEQEDELSTYGGLIFGIDW